MDDNEVTNIFLSGSPSPRSRTKQVAKRDKKRPGRGKGNRINKPTSRQYDYYDSDGYGFSEGEGHQPKMSNEEKKRNRVKDQCQLTQYQQDRRSRWEADRGVEDLTGDDDSPKPTPRSSFDGVKLDNTDKTEKIKDEMRRHGFQLDEEGDSTIRNENKSKKGRSRGRNQQGSSLSNLDKGNQRILNKDRAQHTQQRQPYQGHGRNDDPLDMAEEQRQNTYTTAADFRKKSNNFTHSMGNHCDAIFHQKQPQYGKGNMQPRHRRQKQRQKEHIQVTRQENFFDREPRIPRKKKKQDDPMIELGVSNNLEDIIQFNQDTDHTSSASNGKSKKRLTMFDELEKASDKRHLGANSHSPLDIDMNLTDDGDTAMRDEDGDCKMSSDVDYADHINSISNEYVSPERIDNYKASKGGGRSVIPYTNDYETRQSMFEDETTNTKSPPGQFTMLRLQKMNNGGSGNKKKANQKSQISISEHLRKKNQDDLIDSDSDDNRATNREKGDTWNTATRTRNRLKRSGMAPVSDTSKNDYGWINTRNTKHAPRKRNRKPSSQSSTNWGSPRATRSRSRPKKKVEGSTNDNAITIDSSSDESSADDMEIDGCSMPPKEFEDDELILEEPKTRRSTRLTGQLASIDVARIAVGRKVFKSKCALKFQFGTKYPYVLFVLYTERTKREIKVFLNEEDLKEMAYYVAKDENDESEEYDDTLSIISFRVKPTEANNLDQFADWYDGIDEDGSESKYITVELRDKDQFSTMLTAMSEHQYLRVYTHGGPILFHDLDNYTKALVNDDKAEKAMRRKIQTRRGKNKPLSDSENKLLVVYPFEVEEEKLKAISSDLTELNGNRLGVDEVEAEEYDTDVTEDDNQEDGANESNNNVENAPSTRSHYLTIREDDKDRLEPGQFLNDTLVDFWMSWISRRYSGNHGPNQVHFFTSHFLSTIQDEGPQGVATWTVSKKKRIDVFEKKFIFVPVNGDLHWSLCVIVNPGLIGKAQAESDSLQSELDEEWPCILFLDSLKMHRKNQIAKIMRAWLNFEWNRSEHKQKGLDPFTVKSMRLVAPKVPYQENGCDCGVFVCRYAYNLYIMRNQTFSFLGMSDNFKDLITKGQAFNFGMDDIARIREEMKALVASLTELYAQFKQKEKALKAAAKRKENDVKASSQGESAVAKGKENSPVQNSDTADEPARL